ncbi:MAG: rhodanese-like domain-containing protein, partial [Gemmatimonadota bacterium]|nr:rhodanese-like domain-containing protein [Gemmatimonadota bacterium]
GGNAEAARGFEELDASSVAGLLKSETPPYLIDVREPWEWAVSSLANRGARLIPLGELGARLGEVPKETPVVVYCRSGQRSRNAARELVAAGYGPVTNLSGGLLSWAESVDPDLPVV